MLRHAKQPQRIFDIAGFDIAGIAVRLGTSRITAARIPRSAPSLFRRVRVAPAIPNRVPRASGTSRQQSEFLRLVSHNDGRSMNPATRDKMIGAAALFAAFAYFSESGALSPSCWV